MGLFMQTSRILRKLALLMVASLLTFQIADAQSKDTRINNPYSKKKDKTYIPGSDEKTPEPSRSGKNMDSGHAEADVESLVYRLFTAMNRSDANGIKALFTSDARIVATESNGTSRSMTIAEFGNQIAKAARGSLEEKVTSMEVRVDDALATAWVGYDFYINGNFSHCGVDAFQMIKTNNGWRIMQIADTRRKECKPMGAAGAINATLDNWHMAGAKADARSYFNLLSADGFFLGTDPSENWDKNAFYKFAKPFFDKGQAWDFKPSDRKVYFSEDGKVSWFNELLDTWMGKCRGSGVMTKDDQGNWKLKQYNLAILVPNEKVQEYVKIIGK